MTELSPELCDCGVLWCDEPQAKRGEPPAGGLQLTFHPTPVSERPWEREGWCDSQGRCWLGGSSTLPDVPAWIYGPAAWAARFPDIHRLLLPADAMPVPTTINP